MWLIAEAKGIPGINKTHLSNQSAANLAVTRRHYSNNRRPTKAILTVDGSKGKMSDKYAADEFNFNMLLYFKSDLGNII